MFISIDSGKHTTKGLLEYKRKTYAVMFRTKMMQITNQFGMELQPNSYKVKFSGREYVIGDMVSEDYSDHNLSKESLMHKLAIYTAIVELMNKANLQFHNIQLHVAINSPINVYKSERLKNSYKLFMENHNRPIAIRINGKGYMFKLQDITICFEGMGSVYQDTAAYSKHSSAILDLGGLNTTMCVFNGIRPNFDSMIVSNLGINNLKANLSRNLVERYGISVSSDDLEQIIKNGYFSHGGKKVTESMELIAKTKENHIDNVINFAKRHGYTFNQDKIIFVGGGSILLHEEVLEVFPNAIIDSDSQFANVKSFLKILKVKHAS